MNSHDLLPLPYTQASLAHISTRIEQVQAYLQRPLVLENPSTYLQFQHNTYDEVSFLTELSRKTGCELLLDVNNVYVNSVNHGFDPYAYIRQLHASGATVRQIHLAGHTTHDDYLIDTHDHPVCDAVWALYGFVHQLYGAIPTMIERDDDIPPLDDLLSELATVRRLQQHATATSQTLIANQVQ
jgi:uncharacterized protein (UPF0276 family)